MKLYGYMGSPIVVVTVVHTTARISPKLSCCYVTYVMVTLEAILCSISVIYVHKKVTLICIM